MRREVTVLFRLCLFALTLLPALSLAYSIDIRGIQFRAGHPVTGESLAAASADPEAAFEALNAAEDILKHRSLRLEVNGFTDDSECVDEECTALSLRRAKLTYDWLIEREFR